MEKEEGDLEEITENEFIHSLMSVQKTYLQQVTEFTKLYHNCDDIDRHLNFLHTHNYSIKYYKNVEGGITYEFKEKEPVGFRGNK